MTPTVNEASDADGKTLISISIPVFNEVDNIDRLLDRLRAVSASLSGDYDFEFLFTDNASVDETFDKLAEAAKSDSRIRVLRFARNFGFQQSILANYLACRGAAAIQIDADLQDPPELFAEFLKHWRNGYLVVYGIRRRRKEFVGLNIARKLYYRLIDRLSDVHLPHDAGDFRLIDRRVIDELRFCRDQAPYLRGLIASFGYAQVGIPYDRMAREKGQSKFNLLDLVKLGIDGICSQSTRPLHLITQFGFLVSVLSFLAALTYAGLWLGGFTRGNAGFTTTVILSLVSIGVQSLFVGILGEYIGRIFHNVRGLPPPIVEKKIENGVVSDVLASNSQAADGRTRDGRQAQ